MHSPDQRGARSRGVLGSFRGALLLERWGLPNSIQNCVAQHHTTDSVEQDSHPAGHQLIRAAEALCTHLGAGVNAEGPADDEPYDALVALGLTDKSIETVLSEIEEAGVSMGGVLAV